MLSIFNSFSRRKYPIEIWSHERSSTYKKYKSTVLSKFKTSDDLGFICASISKIKKQVESRKYSNRLVVVMGYETLGSDMEILGSDFDQSDTHTVQEPPASSIPDMSSVMEKVRQCSDPAEKKRILDEYNALVQQQNSSQPSKTEAEQIGIYDARDDLEWVIKRAPNYGIHFVFCFDQPRDFISTRLDDKSFQHKLLFSMSKDDSHSIMGSRKANEVEEGVCLYSDGKESFTLRPHLYRGVPCNGWMVDDGGNVVQKI